MVQGMAKPRRIIDCRVQNGQKFYHVKWSSSWEPEENLASFQDLIDDFWEFIDNCRYANGLCPKPAKKRKVDGTPVKAPTNNQEGQSNSSVGPVIQQTLSVENQPVRVANQQQIKQEFQSNHSNQRTPVSLNQMQNVPQASIQQTIPQSPVLTSLPQSPLQQSVPRSPIQQNNPQIFMRQISNPNMLNQHSTAQKIKEEPADVKPVTLYSYQNMQSPNDLSKQYNFGSPQASMSLTSPSLTGSPSRGRGRGRGRGGSSNNGSTAMTSFGTPIKEEESLAKPAEDARTQSPSVKKVSADNWSNPYTKVAYICRQCSKPLPPGNKQSWKSHFESHFDIKNFGCYICEKRFRLKGDLKRHITNVHGELCIDDRILKFNDKIEIPPIDPEEENIDGLTPSEYVRHVFLCKECDKVLAWKSRAGWKSHYESHLNIKRFGCYVCSQPFRLKGDLKRHVENVHKETFESERVIILA